ncbi:hypothetical protein [Streptomyces sp. ITFR-16]|uniref:hypothetical protein n=1 Tax=Streptomyces sp. ITFR-16 TaxID=3075198 RepID=UPI00288AB714|nr:hypothetical protein [Streptomyces sp. ITFR-16]WNI26705.1 hypothetical protein RLT58_34640 [Streptomyces sp. ITFR-16]
MSGREGEGMNGPAEKPLGEVSVQEGGRLLVRVRLPLPATARPRLLLRLRPKKGKPEVTGRSLDLEPAEQGWWRAVLEADPALEEGRWDAYVVGAPGADRAPLLPGPRDLRTLVSGGGDVSAAPVTVRVPYATKDGRLAVRAWRRATHAEAGRIVVAGDSMTVAARLFGARLGDGAAVALSRRGRDAAVRQADVRAEGDQDFSFTVGYKDLLVDGGGPVVWDVFVRPAAGAARIRVARLLDDIADRKTVFVYPVATLGEVSVRPYYTLDNDLSVEVAPLRPR